jgi:hypothetical protein
MGSGAVWSLLDDWREDYGLEVDAVADGDHDFLEGEKRLGRGLRGGSWLLRGGGNCQQDCGEEQMGWAQTVSP